MKLSLVAGLGALVLGAGVGAFVFQQRATEGAVRATTTTPPPLAALHLSSSPPFGQLKLDEPISLERLGLKPNWKFLHSVTGQEAHMLFSDAEVVMRPPFLVWNRIDNKEYLRTQALPLLLTPIHTTGIDIARLFTILDPQFSPDGHTLLAKYGRLGSPGNYRLVLFDLVARRIHYIEPTELYYNAVSWSPDGKFVAFARGGAVDPRFYEFGATTEGPLELCVVNVRSGRVQSVAKSAFLRGPWSWSAPHTLFYSAPASKDETALERASAKQTSSPVLPNVYAFRPEKRRSRLVAPDAWHPVASPDGKNVVCFDAMGTSPASRLNWPDTPGGARLVVVRVGRTSQSRVAIATASQQLPLLQWEPDNIHVLLMWPSGAPPLSHLHIEECNVQTLQKRLVTTLEARDPDKNRSPNDPNFALTGPIVNGHLMVRVNEYFSLGELRGYSTQDTLQDVELASGRVLPTLRIKGAQGTAWSYTR